MLGQHFIRSALFLGLVWLAGCQPPAPDSSKATTGTQEAEAFPSAELITANIQETQTSLLVVFKSIETAKEPKENDIYGEWKIRASVKRTYAGDFKPGDPFVFLWRFEKGITAPKAESVWIGSFNRNGQGDYYVPDNGYVFEYSKELENLFEKALTGKGK